MKQAIKKLALRLSALAYVLAIQVIILVLFLQPWKKQPICITEHWVNKILQYFETNSHTERALVCVQPLQWNFWKLSAKAQGIQIRRPQIKANIQNLESLVRVSIRHYEIEKLYANVSNILLSPPQKSKPSSSQPLPDLSQQLKPWSLGLIRLEIAKLELTHSPASLSRTSFQCSAEKCHLTTRINLVQKKKKVLSNLNLNWANWKEPYSLQFTSESEHGFLPVAKSSLSCRTYDMSRAAKIDWDCGISLKVPQVWKFKRRLALSVSGSVQKDLKSAEAHLPLQSLDSAEWIHGEGEVHLAWQPGNLQVSIDPSTRVQISSFQTMNQILSETLKFSAVAPFNSLEGPLEIQISDFSWQNQTAAATLTTRLNGPGDQTFISSTKMKARGFLSSAPSIELLSDIEQAHLYLPTLGTHPTLVPDSRFQESKETVKSPSKIKLNWRIRTRRPGALALTSPDYHSKFPFTLDTQGGQKTLSYYFRLEPVSFQIFKRQATINQFSLSKSTHHENSYLSGNVEVPIAEYQVFVQMNGTLKNPKIVFSSEPYLEENQILSLLFLGRPMDQISFEERDKLGQMKVLFAEAAFNLMSFYYLASTPIENVFINPVTNELSLKLRLQDGTYFTLGTQIDRLNRFGLRQRLTQNIYLSTEVKNPLDKQDRGLSGFLEWTTQY